MVRRQGHHLLHSCHPLKLDPLAIEANLAYAVNGANGRAYNRTQYLKHVVSRFSFSRTTWVIWQWAGM